ncbi:MAG: hypothetical protein KGJ94_10210 [Xanthomonadaceae bacterium]|nr:hypothetical protein [Xanthomonadaceae bacterium]
MNIQSILAEHDAVMQAAAPLPDIALRAPSRVVARIQEVHDVWIHAIAQALEDHARGQPA